MTHCHAASALWHVVFPLFAIWIIHVNFKDEKKSLPRRHVAWRSHAVWNSQEWHSSILAEGKKAFQLHASIQLNIKSLCGLHSCSQRPILGWWEQCRCHLTWLSTQPPIKSIRFYSRLGRQSGQHAVTQRCMFALAHLSTTHQACVPQTNMHKTHTHTHTLQFDEEQRSTPLSQASMWQKINEAAESRVWSNEAFSLWPHWVAL